MVSGEDCPSKTNPLIHLSNDPSMNHMGDWWKPVPNLGGWTDEHP
jgi:hypothetical protein